MRVNNGTAIRTNINSLAPGKEAEREKQQTSHSSEVVKDFCAQSFSQRKTHGHVILNMSNQPQSPKRDRKTQEMVKNGLVS